MEIIHLLLIWISVAIHLIAILLFVWRYTKLKKLVTSCCKDLCGSEESHQDSHLDRYNLRVHYKRDEGVVIEGLPITEHCNIACDQESNLDRVSKTDISLSPLPSEIRDKCPTSACQITYS